MTSIAYLTYDKLEAWLYSISGELQALNPDLIVGILRGGTFPAILASHITGANVGFMRFDRQTGQAAWDSAIAIPPPGSTVLLCEDFAGSGVTLWNCRAFLQERGLNVKTLTLAFDHLSRIKPDFYNDMTGSRTIFPWECHTLTPAFSAAQAATADGLGALNADHTYDRWAFDLDGVFLPDISSEIYARDLQEALRLRRLLDKDPDAPVPPPGSTFITGRPDGRKPTAI